ncbi:MAG: EamA family transporter, partial [Actinomycetota bacterium]
NPVLAALIGWVVLDQSLQGAEWLAIAAIVTANTVSVLTADHQAPAPSAAATSPQGPPAWSPSSCPSP